MRVNFSARNALILTMSLMDWVVVGGLAFGAGLAVGRDELFAYRAQVTEQRRIDNAALYRCQAKSCPQTDAPDRLGVLLLEGKGHAE